MVVQKAVPTVALMVETKERQTADERVVMMAGETAGMMAPR